jgi:eukaryotic-like serine/threonine-protein kinase
MIDAIPMHSSGPICQACGAELSQSRPGVNCPACLLQLALDPEPELPPEREISHYVLLEKLGRGGMGEVYRARDTRLNRQVAIKFLPEDVAGHPEALRRFEREARTASSLNHPNICTLYDFGEEDGRPYIVMEVIEGETLQERLDRGPLPLNEALKLARQLADALEAAHSDGVVHRDVKPSNIIIDKRGNAKILDFGIACWVGPLAEEASSSWKTQTGSILGTIPYMSPEQLSGEKVDHRTDLFSLGAVIFKMISGQHPFKRRTTVATMKAICEDPAPSLSEHCDSPQLDRLLGRLLEKDPKRRLSSAREVALMLNAVPRKQRPTGVFSGLWVVPARVTWTAMLSVALLAAFFLGKPMIERLWNPLKIESVAVLPFVNLSHEEQEYLAAGLTDATIARLSEIEGLRVPSRTTMMQYRDSGKSLSRIARDLKADAIVEASVQLDQTETEVYCRVRLIEAGTERTLAGPLEFRRELRDIADLQNSIAYAVADEIRWTLNPETKLMSEADAMDYEAQLSNMRGRYLLEKRSQEALVKAVDHFRDAIEREPDYAEAHAGLATAYVLLGSTGYSTLPPDQVMPKAREAGRRALELSEELPEAHAALGIVAMSFEWDWDSAERHLRRAVELDPEFASGLHWYGLFLAAQGNLEPALEQIRKAVAIEPLSPVYTSALARVHYYMRDYRRARQGYQKVLELEPGFTPAQLGLGLVLLNQGSFTEAVAEFERSLSEPMTSFLKRFEQMSPGEASSELRNIQKLAGGDGDDVSAFHLAVIYVILGRQDAALLDQAFMWLDAVRDSRSEYLVYINVDPIFDELREDPRFRQLLRRIGLEPA